MKSLSKKLNQNKDVKHIAAGDFAECVKKVFETNLYQFYLNSELIDINDRFRIFEFNNIVWLAKKSKKHKAVLEQENAKKAKKLLDGKVINNKKLIIVEPVLIEAKKDAYLITRYYGHSLQEYLYSEKKLFFDFDDLKQLMELLDKNNMVFRGLLPRNIISTSTSIYLLDWEDVIFFTNHKDAYLNLQFKTNFLLNWGYIFNEQDLKSIINDININKIANEPKLNKYEKVFANFASNDIKINNLREKILEIVLFAEKNFCNYSCDFVIRPNDIAHLVSDIFTYEIDVLFDLCLYNLRKHNEQLFLDYLVCLSDEIIKEYSKQYIDRHNLILYIILLLDINQLKTSSTIYRIEDWLKFVKAQPNTLTNKYLFESSDFKEKLAQNLQQLLLHVDKSFSLNQEYLNKIVKYLITLQTQNNFFEKVFENKYFILEQNAQYKFFPRFYTLKIKPDYSINQTEVIDKLATIQKIIRETFASFNIKQVGIYAEEKDQEFLILFIPFYQTILKNMGIDPDNYQPYLNSYLKYKVDKKTICKFNKNAHIRIIQRIRQYG